MENLCNFVRVETVATSRTSDFITAEFEKIGEP